MKLAARAKAFLAASLAASSMAASAADVAIIADSPITVECSNGGSYDLLEGDYEYTLYECYPLFDNVDYSQTPISGYECIWYTLPNNVTSSEVLPKVEDCTLKLTNSWTIAKSEVAKGHTHRWYGKGDIVICPKQSYINFDLTFDCNGATSGKMESVSGLNIDSTFKLPTNCFSIVGYSFNGWTNRHGQAFSDGQQVQGSNFWSEADWAFDGKLFATWKEQVTSVTVSGENCTVAVTPDKVKYTDSVKLEWKQSPQDGYDYDSPAVEVHEGSSASGNLLATYNPNASSTSYTFNPSQLGEFYEQLHFRVVYRATPKEYAITVKVDDSSDGRGKVSPVLSGDKRKYGSTINLIATANDGYVFSQWSDGSTEATHTVTVKGDATYAASFTGRVYKITFDPQGGSCDEKERSLSYGEYFTTMPTAKQYLKKLKGWYDAPNGGDQITATRQYVWTIDITLYAQWEDADVITIDTEVVPQSAGSVTGGGKFEINQEVELTAVPSNGYHFVSWRNDHNQELTDNPLSLTVIGNDIYTAYFTGNVYTVTYRCFDGTPSKQSREVRFGEPYGEPPTVTPDDPDYELGGWYTDYDGEGDRIDSTNLVTTANNHNLIANWVKQPIRYFRFDSNGGTGSMADQKVYCRFDTNLTVNGFVKIGSVFMGWATNGTSKVVFEDGAKIEADVAKDGETETLYAVWRELTLSEAMHCTTLDWSQVKLNNASSSKWTVYAGEGCGYGSDSCVRQGYGMPYVLTAKVIGSGELSFWWKANRSGISLAAEVIAESSPRSSSPIFLAGSTEWQLFTLSVSAATGTVQNAYVYLSPEDTETGDCIVIDQMTWSTYVEPTATDAREVSSLTVGDGTLKFGVENADGRFSYRLRGTNDLGAARELWPAVWTTNGSGSIEIELPQPADQPAMFYYLETIRKQ